MSTNLKIKSSTVNDEVPSNPDSNPKNLTKYKINAKLNNANYNIVPHLNVPHIKLGDFNNNKINKNRNVMFIPN